jgi:phage baseplate assembly protein W
MARIRSINLKFPLQRSPTGAFETNNTTINAVRDDLKILILTNFGERPIQYDFGANLRSVVFEQGSGLVEKAKDLITIAVNKWMPFVVLDNIQVLSSEEDTTILPNQVRIIIEFSVGQITGVLDESITV